jgi:hypothetical protein
MGTATGLSEFRRPSVLWACRRSADKTLDARWFERCIGGCNTKVRGASHASGVAEAVHWSLEEFDLGRPRTACAPGPGIGERRSNQFLLLKLFSV